MLRIELHLEKFLKLTGLYSNGVLNEIVSRFNIAIERGLHLSRKTVDTIYNECDNLNRIGFRPVHNIFTADVNVDFITVEPDGDGIMMTFSVEMHGPKLNGKPTTNPDELISLVSKSNQFQFWNELDDFEYQFLSNPMNVIWNGAETLFENKNMFVGKKVIWTYKGRNVWQFKG